MIHEIIIVMITSSKGRGKALERFKKEDFVDSRLDRSQDPVQMDTTYENKRRNKKPIFSIPKRTLV